MILKNRYKKYDAYKDSGVEWLGEIPEGWSIVRFKHIAKTKKGKLPQKIVSEKNTDMPPYMSMEYLRGGEENQWVLDNNAEQVKKGETLLLWDGSNAGEFIKSRKGVISSTVALIKFSNIHKDFSWYYTKILERCLRQETIGMGIPHVNGEQLKNLMVLIPPLPEQTTIANFLDEKTTKIDSAIAQKEKLVALLKEQKKIIIQNAVTRGLNPNVKMKDSGVEWIEHIPKHWAVKRLKNVSKIIDCKNRTPEYFENEEYLVVRTSNVKNGNLTDEKRLLTNYKNFLKWTERGIPKVNSILFTREAPAGEACLVPRNEKLCLGQRMMSINCNSKFILNKFLLYMIYSPVIQIYIQLMSSGSTVTHLRIPQVYDMPVVSPPVGEQKQIVTYIETQSTKIDKAICLQEKQIEKLKEYKAILIDNAVTGKIKAC